MHTLIILCLGLLVLVPFSKDARRLVGGILSAIFVYVIGWIASILIFITLYGMLYAWSLEGL